MTDLPPPQGFVLEVALSDADIKTLHAAMESYGAACAAAEREACIAMLTEYQVPVGNSPAGEMAADWTLDALREIRAALRARGE